MCVISVAFPDPMTNNFVCKRHNCLRHTAVVLYSVSDVQFSTVHTGSIQYTVYAYSRRVACGVISEKF